MGKSIEAARPVLREPGRRRDEVAGLSVHQAPDDHVPAGQPEAQAFEIPVHLVGADAGIKGKRLLEPGLRQGEDGDGLVAGFQDGDGGCAAKLSRARSRRSGIGQAVGRRLRQQRRHRSTGPGSRRSGAVLLEAGLPWRRVATTLPECGGGQREDDRHGGYRRAGAKEIVTGGFRDAAQIRALRHGGRTRRI